MVTTKDYVIIAIVCLFAVAAVVGIAVVGANSVETQADILEETEIVEETIEATEETIPETTSVTKPTESPVVEETESDITEATEPPVKETQPSPKPTPKPTEPPVTEETKPTPKPTEPPVEETEPPVVEETEPVIEETEPAPEPTEPPVTEEETEKDPYDPVELLACVIYQEAGGDNICDECRYRVADVVLNRVADSRYPDTIHGVLTQRSQYGRFYWTGVVWPSRASGEPHAVERAYNVAKSVVAGTHSELYGNGYIYQAEFVQGYDNIYCCGHYFGK